MRRLAVLALLSLPPLVSYALGQPLWGEAQVGMSVREVLSSVANAALVPEAERESDVFGTDWMIQATSVHVFDLEGTATFGFDDEALRVVKIEFESELSGLAADAQCAGLAGGLSSLHGVAVERDRRESLGFSLTQATWLDGTIEVVLFCFGTPSTTSFFIGIRPLSERELSALAEP